MKGISGKLVAWLVSLSLVILLVVGAMEYHAGKLAIDQQLDLSFEKMSNRLQHSLRNPVYSFDVKTVKDVILGEFSNENVYAILVWTQERKRLLTGIARSGSKFVEIVKRPKGEKLLHYAFPVRRDSLVDHATITIGEVDFYLDRSVQESRLIDSLIVNLSKIALVIIIILGLFELVVTRSLVRPLEAIYARIHRSGHIEEDILMEKKDLGGFSELQELDDTYQLMLETLHARQKRLRESEQNYREIFNAANDAILLINANSGEIADVNDAMLNMFGYSSRESFLSSEESKSFFAFLDLTQNEVRKKMDLTIESGPHIFESRANNKQGDIFWVEVSLLNSNIGGQISVLAVIRDISKRKEDEELLQYNQKLLEDRVAIRTRELENKNKELESFSYMVSHDLRSPLRAIDGFCQILKEDYEPVLDEQGKKYLDNVRAASQRLGNLIDDLLQLSRVSRQEINITSVDLSGLVNMTVEKLTQSEKYKNVDVAIQRDVITDGDEGLLQVVIENLVNNAFKYSSTKDSPKIEFGTLQKGSEQIFYVKDNGVGFEMAYVHKLFLPFQRLHGREFEGTGIGLASVKTIIDHHQGRVWAESIPNQGSVFYFTLGKSKGVEKLSGFM